MARKQNVTSSDMKFEVCIVVGFLDVASAKDHSEPLKRKAAGTNVYLVILDLMKLTKPARSPLARSV